MSCAPGTYSDMAEQASCGSCEAGTFQTKRGQTACDECMPGTWCAEGAVAPEPCPAGTYSNVSRLEEQAQCLGCPRGFHCEAGESAPEPCPSGRFGRDERLTAEAFCISCPALTTSLPGASACAFCEHGYFARGTDASGDLACFPCEPQEGVTLSLKPREGAAWKGGASCSEETIGVAHGATSLATVNISAGFWRLGPNATELSKCASVDGHSPCIGGTVAGDAGSGYCLDGYSGPRCEVCANTTGDLAPVYFDVYYNPYTAACEQCPALFSWNTVLPLIGAAVLAALAVAVRVFLKCFSKQLREPIARMKRVVARVQQLDLAPRFKLLITYYQLIAVLPKVYKVRLPQSYTDSCSWFTWMGELNLDEYLLPGQCMGRFADRLLFRAVAPLVLIVAIGLVSMLRGNFAFIYVYLSGNASAVTTRGWLKVALRTSLRFSLFASFCLTPNVSRSIFASFDCVTFELDGSEPGASTRQSFLRNDLTLECYGEAHRSQVLLKAYVFLLIWPIGMPLLYVLVLLPVREDLRKQKQTRMVRATRFLHKEYQPLFFWWESLMLVQRLTLSGWVLLLSPQDDAARIFVGLLVAIGC